MAKPTGKAAPPGIVDDAAPFIFADLVSTFGFWDNVGQIALECGRLRKSPAGAVRDFVVVAHLRLSLSAIRQLREAIDGIELMARPSVSESKLDYH